LVLGRLVELAYAFDKGCDWDATKVDAKTILILAPSLPSSSSNDFLNDLIDNHLDLARVEFWKCFRLA
jgi:hypothetical protein